MMQTYDTVILSIQLNNTASFNKLSLQLDRLIKFIDTYAELKLTQERLFCKVVVAISVSSRYLRELLLLLNRIGAIYPQVAGVLIEFEHHCDHSIRRGTSSPTLNTKYLQQIITLKRKYPILNTMHYLNNSLANNFNYRCHPYLWCNIQSDGSTSAVALPCLYSSYTEYFNISADHKLIDIWRSARATTLRRKVMHCNLCYSHSIVVSSHVLGDTLRNLAEVFELLI
jgi:hypothetical protein